MSKTVKYYMIVFLLCSIIGIVYDLTKISISIYYKIIIIAIITIWGYTTYKLYTMLRAVQVEDNIRYNKRKELAPQYGQVNEKPSIDNELNAKTIAYHLKQTGYEKLTNDTKLKLNEKGDK